MGRAKCVKSRKNRVLPEDFWEYQHRSLHWLHLKSWTQFQSNLHLVQQIFLKVHIALSWHNTAMSIGWIVLNEMNCFCEAFCCFCFDVELFSPVGKKSLNFFGFYSVIVLWKRQVRLWNDCAIFSPDMSFICSPIQFRDKTSFHSTFFNSRINQNSLFHDWIWFRNYLFYKTFLFEVNNLQNVLLTAAGSVCILLNLFVTFGKILKELFVSLTLSKHFSSFFTLSLVCNTSTNFLFI